MIFAAICNTRRASPSSSPSGLEPRLKDSGVVYRLAVPFRMQPPYHMLRIDHQATCQVPLRCSFRVLRISLCWQSNSSRLSSETFSEQPYRLMPRIKCDFEK
jgi:hypothetical protein